jgi:hypothetical protein
MPNFWSELVSVSVLDSVAIGLSLVSHFDRWLITNSVWFSFAAISVALVCRWSVSAWLAPMLVPVSIRHLVVQWGILAVVGGFGWRPGWSYIYGLQIIVSSRPHHSRFNFSCSLNHSLILKTVFTRFNILFYLYVFLVYLMNRLKFS